MKRIKWTNKNGLRVLTDAGYKDFSGVAMMGRKQMYKISFTDDSSIEVSSKHAFFTDMLDSVRCCDLISGDVLYGRHNDLVVSNVEKTTIEDAYDLIEVEGDERGNHRYFTNGVLSHNCEFISSDALLVSSAILQLISKKNTDEYTEINNFKFWEQIQRGERYLVAVDPSTGSGSDFSVITVVHFPSMVQVAEYRENTMSSPEVYKRLKWLINLIERVGSQCYFTIENNGVGEGLIALYMNDENPPAFAEFVTDSVGTRLGMNTNGRTKITSCVNFKEMVEGNKVTIKSEITITELKSFVRKKGSYEAQEGSTDDCISSWLLITRILEEISSYEQDAFDKLYTYDETSYNDMGEYDEADPDSAPLGIMF